MSKFSFSILALTLVFTACRSNTGNDLSGKWKSVASGGLDFSITFTNDSNFIAEVTGGNNMLESINGTYGLRQDTFLICDNLEKPVVMCSYSDTGKYIFTKKGDTVFFKPISEPCAKRVLTFEIGLVKIKE